MKINIIVAVAENNVIGNNNSLIWHISEDLKRFKKLTLGKPIIMGRKTYESLPFKPLPKRKNIIISRNSELNFEGAELVNSPQKALDLCHDFDEVFICGGAEIYKHFMNIANKMYITKVKKEFNGDTFFPEIDTEKWKIVSKSETFIDEKSKIQYNFIDYERVL